MVYVGVWINATIFIWLTGANVGLNVYFYSLV
jgi:hypothetical protein